MKKSNIALVGMMGSGKSFSSKRLGELLHREVVSTDQLIERKEGRAVKRIFEESGEEYFRRIENDAVKEVAQRQGVIIDCGGGVVLDPQNIANLKKNGIVIYLKASAEFLYEKVRDQTNRPLLKITDPFGRIKELLAQREVFYEQADYTIETTGMTIEAICEEILAILSDKKKHMKVK